MNCEIHIVMLLITPLTESQPLEMCLLFMTKTRQEENGALERMNLLSHDVMVTSKEPLFELKLRQEVTKLRRLVQRLYSLEVRCRNHEAQMTISSRRAEPCPAVSTVISEQQPDLKRPSHGKLMLANSCWQTSNCWQTRAFTRQTQQH